MLKLRYVLVVLTGCFSLFCVFLGCLSLVAFSGCGGREEQVVAVYTALDEHFAEPIFEEFTHQTGIKVLPRYDTGPTGTMDLMKSIVDESARPQCDVFWDDEVVNTIRLKKRGLLAKSSPENSGLYPAAFRDPDGMWYGFAARARVLVVNRDRIKEIPGRVEDMAERRFRSNAGITQPLSGAMASHAACLFALLGDAAAKKYLTDLNAAELIIAPESTSCVQAVCCGEALVGLANSDDAIKAVRNGQPLDIVFPDSGAGEIGTLMIPNTAAMIKNGPNAKAARKLINYLLSPEVEERLAQGPSAQIPLNSTYIGKHPLGQLPPNRMDVDFEKAADKFDLAMQWLSNDFLK